VLTGQLPGVQCGETLRVVGEWTRHPQHGAQFKVTSFSSELPATVYGIRKFLGSGLVRGIGKVYANKIVDRFGADTLRVISEESARLREVDGIGPQRAHSIKAAWDEQSSLRDVLVFLQQYGVTTGLCVKLVKQYGAKARQILEGEPYRVAREIHGIGFKTADKIALNLGIPNDSPERVDAGIIFALQELEEDGHTGFPKDDLLTRCADMLGTPVDKIRERFDAMLRARDLKQPGMLLQLPHSARFEEKIAAAVARLEAAPSALPAIRVDAAVEWAQSKAGFTFGEDQSEAVRAALRAKFSILTGGPGTGKTTILRALVSILRAKQVRVHLAAPTGRAAQRLAETTGGFAQTIHRLLRFDPKSGAFTVNTDHPLATEFLVVDEASMLDTRLAAALLAAVPAGAHVLLVGDADQLPSVGAGNVLKDLIASQLFPVTRLGRIFRQMEGSFIVQAAHAANRGEVLLPRASRTADEIDWSNDFHLLLATTPEACLEAVLQLVQRQIPRHTQLDVLKDVQVLAPMHKGVAGVGNLNLRLQNTLNRNVEGVRGSGYTFLVGDKVIQLRNNYDKGIFNGDTGVVTAVDSGSGILRAQFDGEELEFDRGEVQDLSLAYAMSIHKSQGSEYPVVVVPLLKAHFMMLTRNLIYTAMTRGKRRVFIVGDPAAYAMAVRNAEVQVRHTELRNRLAEATRGGP
jgi:exodeoxyribonuclease V alpha subunit